MTVKDIFDEPFDEGTIVKLEIFQKYFEEWLPTFLMGPFKKPIQVFDFFAGSGADINGIQGSPIRIVEIINKYSKRLEESNKQVYLFFNDLDKSKIDKLEEMIKNKVKDYNLTTFVSVSFSNTSFSDCLTIYKNQLLNGCNLIFIDQNGFKQVNENVFQFLISLDTTEFIFFISSSVIHRFAMMPEIQDHHPKFDFDKIQNTSRKSIHNVICEEYHKYIPGEIKNYSLIPFSIMKDDRNNIYGLIFVTKNILGADKFLHTVWTKNIINGNANFDIDEDLKKDQLNLFENKKLSKIEAFQKKLRDLILSGTLGNNVDAYIFTINCGHTSNHANEEIIKMKKEKLIEFDNPSSLVNYDMVIKKRRILEYKVVE